MKSKLTLNKLTLRSLTVALLAIGQGASADTRVQIPVIPENTQVFNALVIRHGCDNPVTGTTSTPVFGQSVVFPNLVDSIISTKAVGSDPTAPANPYAGGISDFLQISKLPINKIQSKDVFAIENQKLDSLGNVIGFWGGNGNLPGVNYIGLNPFVTGAIPIQPASCAVSVTFVLGIVDVCKMTNLSGFTTETVNMWTPAVGSNYDGTADTNDGYDSPATLKVTRNLTANPLPASCGAGVEVTVTPSAAQLNRDFPVLINGIQAWPLP